MDRFGCIWILKTEQGAGKMLFNDLLDLNTFICNRYAVIDGEDYFMVLRFYFSNIEGKTSGDLIGQINSKTLSRQIKADVFHIEPGDLTQFIFQREFG